MKNVNDVYFDTNISIYIICISICIIYVHDDVYVSAYEYVNVYADDNEYVYR